MSERHFDAVPIASMANTFIYKNPLLTMTLFNVKLNHKNGNITFAVTVFLGKLSNDDLLYTTTQKHVFFNYKVQYITKILLNTLKALIIVIKTMMKFWINVFADKTQKKKNTEVFLDLSETQC